VENRLDPISVVAHYCGMEVDAARTQYEEKCSDNKEWEQQQHAEAYLLCLENVFPSKKSYDKK